MRTIRAGRADHRLRRPIINTAGLRIGWSPGDSRMKIALLGGGGFRTPHTLRALLEAAPRLKVTEVVLHDLQASRLERITAIFDGLLEESHAPAPFGVRPTTNVADALRGAAFVLCAIRV